MTLMRTIWLLAYPFRLVLFPMCLFGWTLLLMLDRLWDGVWNTGVFGDCVREWLTP